MKTIKQKIFSPFITVIIVMALLIMVIFNISIRVYSQKVATEELKNTVKQVETIIRNQVPGNINDESRKIFPGTQAFDRLALIRNALRVTTLSPNTEFFIVSAKGEILFPRNIEDLSLSEKSLKDTFNQLSEKEPYEILRLKLDEGNFISTYRDMGSDYQHLNLVFVASANMANDMVKGINFILFFILFAATAISAVIALGVSKGISSPIARLSVQAKKIGAGDFSSLENDESSQEIADLTKSMNEMSQKLKDTDRAQKAFFQNASHELRTPLMSIGGYAEGIAKGIFPDADKKAEIICEESRRLSTLVEQLLTLSRIENTGYEVNMKSSNLCDLMKDFIQKSGGIALQKNKKIIFHCDDEQLFAMVDADLLAQAVLNVLGNGIKYAKNKVDVVVSRAGEKALVTISDDGNGIEPEDLPHIFERFYKGKDGSFGLGLTIAKSAINYMNGSLNVYNGEQGAVFEIFLPLN